LNVLVGLSDGPPTSSRWQTRLSVSLRTWWVWVAWCHHRSNRANRRWTL